ncbi:Ubiquitin carboxyl-terminal hydrolase 16, partial [Cladochytrium tenue]
PLSQPADDQPAPTAITAAEDQAPPALLLSTVVDVDDGHGSSSDSPSLVVRCPHLRGAAKIAPATKALTKALKGSGAFACQTCKQAGKSPRDQSLWVCLGCGAINCGRDDAKHAEAHSNATRHVLVMQADTLECWCYACDEFIMPSGDRNQLVKEAQAMIRKLKPAPRTAEPPPPSPSDAGSTTLGRSKAKGKNAAPPPPQVPAPGLKNLGNTCFFNSVMQCMTYSPPVQDLVIAAKDPESGPSLSPPVNLDKPLTRALVEFLDIMRVQAQCGRYSIVNPGGLFTQLGNKYKVYKSFRQQDSHELLRCLLDGVKDEQMKKDDKGKPLANQRTFVDDVFGGKLVSAVICDACKTISYNFEDFLDISLPIVVEEKKSSGGGILSAFRRLSRSSSPSSRRPSSPSRSIDELIESVSGLSLRLDGGGSASAARSPKLLGSIRRSNSGSRRQSPSRAADYAALVAAEPTTPPPPPLPSQEDIAKGQLIARLFRAIEAAPAVGGGGGGGNNGDKATSVEKCLRAFMSVDTLDGPNSLACETCAKRAKEAPPSTTAAAVAAAVPAPAAVSAPATPATPLSRVPSAQSMRSELSSQLLPPAALSEDSAVPAAATAVGAATAASSGGRGSFDDSSPAPSPAMAAEAEDSDVPAGAAAAAGSGATSVSDRAASRTSGGGSSSIGEDPTGTTLVPSGLAASSAASTSSTGGVSGAPNTPVASTEQPGAAAASKRTPEAVIKPAFAIPLRDESSPAPSSSQGAPRLRLRTRSESATAAAAAAAAKDKAAAALQPPGLTRGFKRYLLHSAPRVLVLHLKRFQQLGASGRTRKVEDHVAFTQTLDLAPFLAPDEVVERVRASGAAAATSGAAAAANVATVEGGEGTDSQPVAAAIPSDGAAVEAGQAVDETLCGGQAEVATAAATVVGDVAGSISSSSAKSVSTGDGGGSTASASAASTAMDAKKDTDGPADDTVVVAARRLGDGERYRLSGVVVHAGSLYAGHYVAYVRRTARMSAAGVAAAAAATGLAIVAAAADGDAVADAPVLSAGLPLPLPPSPPEPEWMYISDTAVRASSWDEVAKAQAYLLFYERV